MEHFFFHPIVGPSYTKNMQKTKWKYLKNSPNDRVFSLFLNEFNALNTTIKRLILLYLSNFPLYQYEI